MQCGIIVIFWDFGVVLEGCQLYLNLLFNLLIGNMIIKLVVDYLFDGGDVVVLLVFVMVMNQNIWIEEMNKVKDNYLGINVVVIVYGDDLVDKFYCEVQGLMQIYLDLKVIIVLIFVGIVVVVQVVFDVEKVGDINVIGFGLLFEMVGYIEFGVFKFFVIWNLIDFGYFVIMLVYSLVIDKVEVVLGVEILMGCMGLLIFDDNNEGVMVDLFVYDSFNIDDFKDIF